VDRGSKNELPDPISFLEGLLEGLLPGNPFAGEPPVPRFLLENRREDGVSGEHPLINPMRPGCTAAETTILTRGILEDLGEGMGGFGVLRQGKAYLKGGARAAAKLGRPALAQQLSEIADELTQVHTPEQAGALAERLRPLEAEVWDLGKRCNPASLG